MSDIPTPIIGLVIAVFVRYSWWSAPGCTP